MAHVVVMGVTGCGKSTVGIAIARALEVQYMDADHLHPQENVDKMASGIPLEDQDRWPWLDDVAEWLADRDDAVMACSALKRAYRDVIRKRVPDVVFVHLRAPQAVLEPRVQARMDGVGHFAPTGILDGQYRDLEAPGPDERHVDVDVDANDAEQASAIAIEWIRKN